MSPPRDLFGRLARVVGDPKGQEIGRVAVHAGLITPDQLRDCEAEAARRPADPFRRILEERAGISPQALDVLETLLRENDPSRLLAGRYEMRGELGRGAMGIIRRAWDLQLRREVAIKFLKSDARPSPELLARVRQEAMAVARLNHPHIPVLHDVGEIGGLPYLVMELIQGPSLAERIAEGPLPVREAAAIMEKVARAIHHAHVHGIVHRDIKPDNIRIDPAGEPHILDFGLVHLHGGEEGLTRTGAAVGTPYYMAPEQVRGDRGAIGPRTDVYGLGATLYEAATGRPPFAAATLMEVFDQVLSSEPAPPDRVQDDVPVELSRIILKAMTKEPERRYASALDLAEDLRRHLAGEPVLAHPSSVTFRVWKRIRRSPRAWIAGAAATVLVAASIVVAATSHRRSGQDRQELDAATRRHRASMAYHELKLSTLVPLQELEARWHSRLEGIGNDERVRLVDAAADRVGTNLPEAGAPRAWKGLARFYAGDDAGLREIEAACLARPEDPFPRAILARALIAAYSRELELPDHQLLFTGLVREPLEETPRMVEARTRALEALRPVLAPEAWAGLDHGGELRAFARGADLLGRGRYPEAAAALEEVRQDPGLRDPAGWLIGVARFLSSDYEGAADILESVGRRGWARALAASAGTRMVLSMQAQHAKKEPLPELDRALRLSEEATRLWPDMAPAWSAQGLARSRRAQLMQNTGADPRTEYEAAIEAYSAALRLDSSLHKARLNRSDASTQKAAWLTGVEPQSPEVPGLFDQAIQDAEAVVDAQPGNGLAHMCLGNALLFRVNVVRNDPARAEQVARANSAFLKTMDLRPDDPRPLLALGLLRHLTNDLKGALEVFDKYLLRVDDPKVRQRRDRIERQLKESTEE